MAIIKPTKNNSFVNQMKGIVQGAADAVQSNEPKTETVNAPYIGGVPSPIKAVTITPVVKKSSVSTPSGSSSGGAPLAGVGSNLYASLQQDFQKSDKLLEAEALLDQLTKDGYQSKYAGEIAELTDLYLNREPFKYDMHADPLFRVAQDQAVKSGKMAMQDTVANASSLTGGYGNSWAATAGNQAFQAYLTELYNNVPEYAQMARDQYDQEGADMLSKASLLIDQDETAYSRWMQDYLNYYNAAQDLYNQEYGVFSDDLSRNFNLAQMQNSNYWNEQENQRAWANYQLSKDKFAYDKEMDALALLASESDSDYKTPTDVMFDGALSAYNSGGEDALLAFVEKYPEYDVETLYDYAKNNGVSDISRYFQNITSSSQNIIKNTATSAWDKALDKKEQREKLFGKADW